MIYKICKIAEILQHVTKIQNNMQNTMMQNLSMQIELLYA